MLLHILLALCASTRSDREFDTLELDAFFPDIDGCFVLCELGTSHDASVKYSVYRHNVCLQPSPPFSTFKIPNSLIGLHTDVISPETTLAWNGKPQPVRAWEQDHQLASAFSNSVVWYYQEVARRIGQERMQQNLTALAYGNQEIGGRIDQFWLDGTLQISPMDQVVFLRKLWHDQLPFSDETMRNVRDLMIVDRTDDYCLRGKTGSGRHQEHPLGWFVGFVETGDLTFAYATRIIGEGCHGRRAEKITKEILSTLGLFADPSSSTTGTQESQS